MRERMGRERKNEREERDTERERMRERREIQRGREWENGSPHCHRPQDTSTKKIESSNMFAPDQASSPFRMAGINPFTRQVLTSC